MTRSNIYIVDEGIGMANNLIYVPMCIFISSNVYGIVRNTDIESHNEEYHRLIQILNRLKQQY